MGKLKNKNGMLCAVISLLVIGGMAWGSYAAVTGRLTPQEFTALRLKYKVAAHNFDEYFIQQGKDIYLQLQWQTSEPAAEPSFGATPGTEITVDRFVFGSGLSKSLSFAPAATSTPGGLVKLFNAGRQDMVCKEAILRIKTADTNGGPAGSGGKLQFSLTTSTAASTATADVPNLIASTTVATGTTAILTSKSNHGTSYASSTPFEWDAGTYILGSFNVISADGLLTATSSAYNNAVGSLYLDCFVE